MKSDNQFGVDAVADIPNNENCTEFHDDSWAAGISLIHADHVASVWPVAVAAQAQNPRNPKFTNPVTGLPATVVQQSNGGLVDVTH